jgi:hypothetical protein
MILTPEEAKLYYELHWALLAHANRRLGIIPDSATIDDILALSTTEKKMYVREALYEDPDTLESFITENPEGLSADELAIVASWRHRVSGDFYIARYLKRYTVFLSTTEPERLYGVLGLVDSIEDIFAGRPLPIYVQAVLLPFRDKIVYDGLLRAYNVYFGGGVRSSVKETYNRLKRRMGFIEQLVGPDGEPQVRTSLDRRAPRKPPPDWKPVVDEIVTQAKKIRRTATPAQGSAASLLRAAAKMSQVTLHQPDATEDHLKQLSSVRRALTKLENILYEDLYET